MSGNDLRIPSWRGRLRASRGAPPLIILMVVLLVVMGALAVSAASPSTKRVSVGAEGQALGGRSYQVAISADGRFVAFASSATNLVPDDTNGGGGHLRARSEAEGDQARERGQGRRAG